jgi:hypothetical protein
VNIDELIMLRSLVHAAGTIAEDAPPTGTAVQVVRRDGGVINHVRVGFTDPIEVDELAGAFGPPRELPRLPTGARRVIFPDTQPNDGQRGVTAIAELNRTGQATALVLRPDDFTTT